MDRKRESERRDLKVFLKVYDDKTNQQLGYVVNVTDKGIMITHAQPIDVIADFQLKLALSAEIKGKKELHFTAQSRWTGKDSESDFYNTGFQFIDPSPPDPKIIESLIQDFCFETD